MRASLFFLLILGTARSVIGQTDCSQTLAQAERAYYTGRFADVRALLRPCMETSFNKEQKLEAYKLIALSSIFSRNYERADSTVFTMLKLEPEYELGPADPPELRKRLESFNARPIVGLSIAGGAYVPRMKITEVYSLRDAPMEVTYKSLLGYQIGFGASYYLGKSILFEGSYEFQSVAFSIKSKDTLVETRMNEKQKQQQFGIAGGYNKKWKRVFGQFLVGVAFSSLKSATADLYKLENVVDGKGEITYREQLDFSNMGHRRANITKPFAMMRMSFVQGNGYVLNLFAKYEYSLGGFTENRYSDLVQNITMDWVEDDFKANYLTVGMGITKLFYRVKK
jgi:hypothetical protein